MSLERAENDKLSAEAARRGILPATLAAELVREGLKRAAAEKQVERPASQLRRWLEAFLDDVRNRGDWPPDITVTVFDHIRDEAHELYQAAAEDVGHNALNREIGRLVKERLHARVVKQGNRPRLVKVSRKRGSLIKRASLLEPNTGDHQ